MDFITMDGLDNNSISDPQELSSAFKGTQSAL